MEKPPVSAALDQLGIQHKVFEHTKSISSLEEAAEDRGHKPNQVVRSILFRVREGEYAMALVAGPGQISWKTLRNILGRSRITMATEAEVLSVTGYRVGAVGPFGLLNQVRVLIDAGVMKEDEISIGSGIRNTAVILKSQDMLHALKNAEVVNLLEGQA